MSDLEAARELASSRILRAGTAASLNEPFAATFHRFARRAGEPLDFGALLAHWRRRQPGSAVGSDRYRWELTHARATGIPDYAGTPATWKAWRPAEQTFVDKEPFDYESRLSVPLVTTETAELLLESDDPVASELYSEAEPVLRRDFALYVQARHAWTDTFALWCLAHHPRALARLHPLAYAIGECYAATTRGTDGVVVGTRFPFHERPLASASAQLASGLLVLGSNIDLLGGLVDFVAESRNTDGAWADADEPPDLLTTLVCADLLTHVDPSFSVEPTRDWILDRQEPEGWWRVLGPEVPWLTAAVLDWLRASQSPFAARFRWPHLQPQNRDSKTRLPTYAYFADVAGLFARLDGLRSTPTQCAFVDLAGFRDFNNRFGQDRGDDVLAEFATSLDDVPGARAVRDGGDEFLLVGAPGREGLSADLETLRHRWPRRFRERFGADIPAVAPRILVGSCAAGSLVQARGVLGRAVSPLKKREPTPSPEGVLAEVELT